MPALITAGIAIFLARGDALARPFALAMAEAARDDPALGAAAGVAALGALEQPTPEVLAFLHAGLCQTFLPHSRPASDDLVWQRRAGRFLLGC